MKTIMRYRGLLAVLAVALLLYPAFLLGCHLGGEIAELPQHFREHPIRMLLGFSLNLLIAGFVTWATCFRKRRDPQIES